MLGSFGTTRKSGTFRKCATFGPHMPPHVRPPGARKSPGSEKNYTLRSGMWGTNTNSKIHKFPRTCVLTFCFARRVVMSCRMAPSMPRVVEQVYLSGPKLHMFAQIDTSVISPSCFLTEVSHTKTTNYQGVPWEGPAPRARAKTNSLWIQPCSGCARHVSKDVASQPGDRKDGAT